MAPSQNSKRRSSDTTKSAPKCHYAGNNPPSPGARVNVAVRVRPLNERESETSSIVCVGDDRCLVLNPKVVAESIKFRGQQACAGFHKPHKDYTFMFDKVFSEDKDSEYVFERTTKEMLTTLLGGGNCSVFAYGATGTGKTFTMLGSEDCPGLVSLTASELYRRVDRLRSNGQSCDVAVAFMEVCNEVVRDLLCPKGPSLVVRDDPAKGIAISNLSTHNVKEPGALFEILQKGNRNKTLHATHSSSESSRSHKIIQIYITQTANVTSTSKGIRVSKMSFVDLAGSERVAAGNKDIKDQIREGTKVHLSLLTLGKCFDALSKGGTQRVPYRDSKLTHILKDSLGGTCCTLLMAFVSPSKLSYTDTHNTLKYAERAMKIELQAQKKARDVNAHTPMYSSLVEEYKQKVQGLQRKLDKAENEKSKLEIQVVELKKSLATAKDALLQDQHADAGSIVPASHNNVLSTTTVLSPSIEANEHSDDSRTAYFLDTARKVYAERVKIIRQIWENENILRASVVKENWKQQMAKNVNLLQSGSEDTLKESEPLRQFLQSHAAKRLAAKEKLKALHNEQMRNFECSKDLLNEASAAGCLKAVVAEIAKLELVVERTELHGQRQMFAELTKLLCQKCSHWEDLNSVAVPHLRSLYAILEATNCCCSDQRDTHNAVVKKAKGPGVTWADKENNGPNGQLDLTNLLHAPDWRQATTMQLKSVALQSIKLDDS